MLRPTPAGDEKLAQARPLWRDVQQQIHRAFGDESTDELLNRLRLLHQASEELAVNGMTEEES